MYRGLLSGVVFIVVFGMLSNVEVSVLIV